jgi:hypothetical protein
VDQPFEGVIFGSETDPKAVICPGYTDPNPHHFSAWLKGLEAKGWQISLKPAPGNASVMVAGIPPASKTQMGAEHRVR